MEYYQDKSDEYKFIQHPKDEKKLPEFIKAKNNIIQKVADDFRMPVIDLFKKTHERPIVFPRQIIHYYLMEENEIRIFGRTHSGLIASVFHSMNHSTINHSHKSIENLKDSSTYEGQRIRRILSLSEKEGEISLFSYNIRIGEINGMRGRVKIRGLEYFLTLSKYNLK